MGWLRRAVALVAAAVLGLAGAVRGHAYMTVPASRNFAYSAEGKMGGTFTCVSCLASGGPATLYGGAGDLNKFPLKVVDRYPVCGGSKEHGGVNDYQFDNGGPVDTWLRSKRYRPPAYAAGATIDITVVVQHYHFGLFRFGLCGYDEVTRLGPGGAKGKVRRPVDDCFERGALVNAAPQAPGEAHSRRYYIGADASLTSQYKLYTVRFKLPAAPGCTRCVLLFKYTTGNSCTPADTPAQFAASYLPICGAKGSAPPEQFFNCADITVSGGNVTAPPTAPAGAKRREAFAEYTAYAEGAAERWLARAGPMTPVELLAHLLCANALIAMLAPRHTTALVMAVAHGALLAWWWARRRRDARSVAARIPSPPTHRVEKFEVQELPVGVFNKM